MDEESQVRGCYNITFICTPTSHETVSVLEKVHLSTRDGAGTWDHAVSGGKSVIN